MCSAAAVACRTAYQDSNADPPGGVVIAAVILVKTSSSFLQASGTASVACARKSMASFDCTTCRQPGDGKCGVCLQPGAAVEKRLAHLDKTARVSGNVVVHNRSDLHGVQAVVELCTVL